MGYYRQKSEVFHPDYLRTLQGEILACRYLQVNNLNRDFIGTKGFSVVFRRDGQEEVIKRFPFFKPYLDVALQPECNAFYLNPLVLTLGSRVDPHIDRSLRSYCKTVLPPLLVSVLYVQVPVDLEGGELILSHQRKAVGKIRPRTNTMVYFQGDLTHAVNAVTTPTPRLSLVCEQYNLTEDELEQIPSLRIESRAIKSENLRPINAPLTKSSP